MTGYESKKNMAQDKITDEQGRPITYWGGKAQPAHVLLAAHREEYWCADLTCKKCYGADFRFKHAPPLRPWVGLTDEEICKCAGIDNADTWLFETAYAIEAKLKQKNGCAEEMDR